MLLATFVFQGKGFGRQAEELLVLARHVPVEEYTLDHLVGWVGDAFMAGICDPKVVRIEIGEPDQAPQTIFDSVKDFRVWRTQNHNPVNYADAPVLSDESLSASAVDHG